MSRVDWQTGSHRSTSDRDTSSAPIRFPPDNFKHSLTLFSKSFSSFPRGTCSLSVSRQYLALDGIYRPIRAAFPNNPTRRQCLVVRQGPGTTGLSPSLAPPSTGLGPGPPLRTLLQTTIRTPKVTDFHGGLFPVRSPLLRESLKLKGSRSKCERKPCMIGLEDHSTTIYHGAFHQGLIFQPTTRQCLWEATLHPTKYLIGKGIGVGEHCVTPRQSCPQPNGFGRNLRSKTRWVTGFCNSHQVSHFVTFFIDARAEISVAESHFGTCFTTPHVEELSPDLQGHR
ncbi:hypothetical protein VNO77_27028 [Canavalia gladiata]|uniref:Protein TAR1 n=1 Tax=Canavalia gladiata TaxID=3824 RepID=A0AAN9KUM2_CANGL